MDDAIRRRELLEKYREIARLRDAETAGTLPDPKPSLRALSKRFPGALRELDRLSRPALDALIAELSGGLPSPERWAHFCTLHAFHVSLRGALEAKRWLSAHPAACGADLAEAALSREAVAWADDVALLRTPPHGKLTGAVVKRLARLEAVAEAEIRARVDLRRHR